MAVNARFSELHRVVLGRILDGTMKPGSRIVESTLAAELGVARTSLRSVLQRLADEKLVVHRDYKDTAVITVTPELALEVDTLRRSLAAFAQSLSRHRSSTMSDVTRAFEDLASSATSGFVQAAVEADFRLHRQMIAATGHRLLLDQWDRLEPLVRLCANRSFRHSWTTDELVRSHEMTVAEFTSTSSPMRTGPAASPNPEPCFMSSYS